MTHEVVRVGSCVHLFWVAIEVEMSIVAELGCVGTEYEQPMVSASYGNKRDEPATGTW